MRLRWIELKGEQHPLCYNMVAIEDLCGQFGSIEAWGEAISGPAQALAIGKTIEALLDGGRAYCEEMSMPLPPAVKRPGALIDVSDPELIKTMFSAIHKDQQREVETKNAEPTQAV